MGFLIDMAMGLFSGKSFSLKSAGYIAVILAIAVVAFIVKGKLDLIDVQADVIVQLRDNAKTLKQNIKTLNVTIDIQTKAYNDALEEQQRTFAITQGLNIALQQQTILYNESIAKLDNYTGRLTRNAIKKTKTMERIANRSMARRMQRFSTTAGSTTGPSSSKDSTTADRSTVPGT